MGNVRGVFLFNNFNTYMNHVMLENSGCGLSFRTVQITDFDFVDDAMIFAKTSGFIRAIESFSGEAEPQGLRVSVIEIKVQAFGDISDVPNLSIPVGGEHVEVTQTFT